MDSIATECFTRFSSLNHELRQQFVESLSLARLKQRLIEKIFQYGYSTQLVPKSMLVLQQEVSGREEGDRRNKEVKEKQEDEAGKKKGKKRSRRKNNHLKSIFCCCMQFSNFSVLLSCAATPDPREAVWILLLPRAAIALFTILHTNEKAPGEAEWRGWDAAASRSKDGQAAGCEFKMILVSVGMPSLTTACSLIYTIIVLVFLF